LKFKQKKAFEVYTLNAFFCLRYLKNTPQNMTKNYLVIGASSGIGEAIASQLQRRTPSFFCL
jgi:NADPH:quinone reductase-like Zn-dependent oxidoreductase